jgi:DNA-binding LacI/PurR family transcriptional regulator
VNIFDIAKKTGFSITTVSRVINDTGLVKQETREKILQVMRENNYTPNSLAQGLAKKESTAIGMLVPNINNPFYSEMVRAVQDVVGKNNYALVAVNTDDRLDEEKRILSALIAKRVDGLIFAGGRDLDDAHNRHVRDVAKRIPTVFVCEDIDDPNIYCVNTRKELATRLLTRHLIELGHSRIYFVNTQEEFKPSTEKIAGYRAALEENGISYAPNRVLHCNNTIFDGYTAGQRIAENLNGATAVITASDIMAMGLMNALVKAGYSIPDDISVAGFDNIAISEYFNPSLTTVGSSLYEMAQMAAVILERLISGKSVERRVTVLEPKVVLRSSCSFRGCPTGHD